MSCLQKKYDDIEDDSESFGRPGLMELFNDIKLGLVDTVVVHSLDVLSTSFKAIDKILRIFKIHDTRIILAKQNIDSATPDGRGFFLNVAELVRRESFEEEWKKRKNQNDKDT